MAAADWSADPPDPDDLHDEMRKLAAQRGQTLKGLVIYELRRAVQRAQENDRSFDEDAATS